jgi:UDP-N-acetylmuramyl pentapeptide phosphotransferase/UDP-N-acetylglucosamine-1-phosphate transferase
MHISVILIALISSLAATEATIRVSRWRGILDRPNHRSSHVAPVPRLGGIGIAFGFWSAVVAYWALSGILPSSGVLVAITWCGLMGLLDDLWSLKPLHKYLGQLAGTMLFICTTFQPGSATGWWWAIPVIIFWITGFTNVVNFMDGINGLCAGTGIVYSCAVALIAWQLRDMSTALVAVLLAAACAGFLPHNFPRARTFMGDSGSLFIGSGLALLSVQVVRIGGVRVALALLAAFSAFLWDSTFTLVLRFRRGENIFQAHRSHLYQRLVQAGWSHAAVSGLYFVFHLIGAALGIVSLRLGGGLFGLTVAVPLFLLAGLTLYVYRLEDIPRVKVKIAIAANGFTAEAVATGAEVAPEEEFAMTSR